MFSNIVAQSDEPGVAFIIMLKIVPAVTYKKSAGENVSLNRWSLGSTSVPPARPSSCHGTYEVPRFHLAFIIDRKKINTTFTILTTAIQFTIGVQIFVSFLADAY
jgi:hypothetical protein